MKSNTRISVLISLYNRADYISETIDSVSNQNYENLEIIVVDDGSKDGGDLIVQQLADAGKLILLRHPNNANRGQSASLNLGLKYATGEYIAVLDSDDIFLPNKLIHQSEFLDNNPDIGLVYGMGHAINSTGQMIYDILNENHIETNDPNVILLNCYFHLPGGALTRKAVYDQTGNFNEQLRSGADHDMQIRMSEKTNFSFQPVPVYCYRRHEGSLSVSGTEGMWRNGFIILNDAIKRYPYSPSTIRKRRAVLNFRLGRALLKNRKNLAAAIGRLIISGLLDPLRAFSVLLGKENVT